MEDQQIQHNPSHQKHSWADGYRVRVKGCLSEDLLAWLDLPFEIDPARGETSLCIHPPDQAALYGAILHLRDLGLTLLAVEPPGKPAHLSLNDD